MSPITSTLANGSAYGYRTLAAAGGGSFESIATASGTGSSATITLSSIPSTYQHLQIRILGRSTAAQTNTDLYIRYNSSTSGYANHGIQADGSIADTKTDINGAEMIIYRSLTGDSAAAGIMGAALIDIDDYASTTKNKTLRCLSGQTRPADAQGTLFVQGGFLNNTAAISSLTFTLGVGNWNTASRISLYGIKGA